MDKKPADKIEFVFKTKAEAVEFCKAARVSPAKCEEWIGSLGDVAAQDGFTVGLEWLRGRLPLCEEKPGANAAACFAVAHSRKVSKRGSVLRFVSAVPLFSILSDSEEPGMYPECFRGDGAKRSFSDLVTEFMGVCVKQLE